MAEEAVVAEIEEEAVVVEEVETEEVETEAVEEAEPEDTNEEETSEGELVVSIGEDSPPQEEETQKEYAWAKMRRENREMKAKLAQQETPKSVEVGPEPDLYDDNIDGDPKLFREATQAWLKRKDHADKEQEGLKDAEEVKAQEWKTTLNKFNEKREVVKAKMPNYEELEGAVDDSLTEIQKGAILQCAKDPALLIAALGRNPAKLKELSSLKNAAEFIWSASQMESQMKVSNRKVGTKPEKTVTGSGVAHSTLDKVEAKLEKEADKTGDRTALLKHRRSKQK